MSEQEVKKDLRKREDFSVDDYLGEVDDPRSFRNLLPEKIVSAALEVPGDVLELTDFRLKEEIGKDNAVTVGRLRESLWFALLSAQRRGQKVNQREIYWGITSASAFSWHLKYPYRVALMLRPPISYDVALKEALNESVEQIRDILVQPHIDPKTGGVDSKLADIKRRLFENLSDRVKGMPIQRTENLNVNKEIGIGESFQDAMPTTAEDIDAKIRELEKDISDAKDVTPK